MNRIRAEEHQIRIIAGRRESAENNRFKLMHGSFQRERIQKDASIRSEQCLRGCMTQHAVAGYADKPRSPHFPIRNARPLNSRRICGISRIHLKAERRRRKYVNCVYATTTQMTLKMRIIFSREFKDFDYEHLFAWTFMNKSIN